MPEIRHISGNSEEGLNFERIHRYHLEWSDTGRALFPGRRRLHPRIRPDAHRQSRSWLSLPLRRVPGLVDRERDGKLAAGSDRAALCVAAAGLLLQQGLLRRIQGQDLREALVTIGVSIVVADLLLAFYGGQNYEIAAPDIISGGTYLGIAGLTYPTIRLLTLGIALLVGIALWFLLRHTRLGMIIRAGIDDRAMVSAAGINVQLVFAIVFALGALLAGLAGVIGATNLSVQPGDDSLYLLYSLTVVIIGGMGSVGGAAIGALLVGLVQQYGLAYIPTYSVLITFAMMILVLAIRPQGIAGRRA